MAWQTVASLAFGDGQGTFGDMYLQYDDASTGTSRTARWYFELRSGASIYVNLRDIVLDGNWFMNTPYLLSGSGTIWQGSLAAGQHTISWNCYWYSTGIKYYSISGYIPSGIVAPSGLSVSLNSKTYNSATMKVSLSSYGVPSNADGRYIEAAIMGQSTYGGQYRYATSRNVTSATLMVNNSSATNSSNPLTIQGNKQYWYGGYASNTQTSISTVIGSFYTPCPPLSALSLSSQAYRTYNSVNATISYTRQSDGGAQTRTGYYRYSTNGGLSYTNWTSFGTVSATTGTFTAVLPTSSSITLQVKLNTPNGGDSKIKTVTFSTRATHTAPNFSNFAYEDSDAAVVAVTGNNQVFVQGQSKPKVTISAANKATANDGATVTGYTAMLNAQSIQIPYSSSASVSGTFADNTPTASGTLSLSVAANDSLSLAKSVSKNVTVVPWAAPVLKATAVRTNNFEAETTLSIEGTYSPITVNGAVKNSLAVAYRFKQSSSSTWGSWTNRPITISGSGYSAVDLMLSFDNNRQWDIEVRAVDAFKTTTVAIMLDRGIAIFKINSNDNKCYNNGKRMLTEDDYNALVALINNR